MEAVATVEEVNPQEYGIEVSKANELMGNLPQIQSERAVLEKQYADVVLMDVEQPETAKRARALRLLVKDNRTKGIATWHKTTKEVFLRAGQFIDAVKRREEAVNTAMEEKLEAIEAEAKKGDADKVNDLIADLEAARSKYAFKSKKNQAMYAQVNELIGKVITHIQRP